MLSLRVGASTMEATGVAPANDLTDAWTDARFINPSGSRDTAAADTLFLP